MSHSIAMMNELNAAKRLILKYFELAIGILMHIPGLWLSVFKIDSLLFNKTPSTAAPSPVW